jgi:hypothetical protein
MGSKLQKSTITLARIASEFRNDRGTLHLKDSWSQTDIQSHVLDRLFNVNSMKAREEYTVQLVHSLRLFFFIRKNISKIINQLNFIRPSI